MQAADNAALKGADAVGAEEARTLFAELTASKVVCIAVSGGPDSCALLLLAAHWRAALKTGPKLVALTVDHGLRPESAREAQAAKALAVRLGVAHRTLRWRQAKPSSGIQEAARIARYRLLAKAAQAAGARHILTAHTLDDQAETVLFRLARGSGIAGLAGMRRAIALGAGGVPLTECHPARRSAPDENADLVLVRPLLEVPKTRLIATLAAAGIDFASDPSNSDARFARPRWRALMPGLAREGLGARRLALLARRMARADAALEHAVQEAMGRLSPRPWSGSGPISLNAPGFAQLPEEVAIRLLGRAVDQVGHEGSVELGKLEALCASLSAALAGGPGARFRRTLAGALVTLAGERVEVTPAPPRRFAPAPRARRGKRTAQERKRNSPMDAKKTKFRALLLA